MKQHFYYINDKGEKKTYRGKIENVNGKTMGTVVTTTVSKKMTQLLQENSGTVEIDRKKVFVYKDRNGVENVVSNDDVVIDNKVVKQYTDKFEITFTPEIEETTYFTYFNSNTKKTEIYNGEIIEKDNKYWGKGSL